MLSNQIYNYSSNKKDIQFKIFHCNLELQNDKLDNSKILRDIIVKLV
jgi:hypothetical protein